MQSTMAPQSPLTVQMDVAQIAELGNVTGLPGVATVAGMGVAMFNLFATIQDGELVRRDWDAPMGWIPFLGWMLLTLLLGVGTWILITLLSGAIKKVLRRRRGIPEAFNKFEVPVTVGPQGLDIEGLGVTSWADITRIHEGNDDNGVMYVYCTGHYDLILTLGIRDREKMDDVLRMMREYCGFYVSAQS